MALKRNLNERERFGLTDEEIKMAERYLRKNKTAGAIKDLEAQKLVEMYYVGCSYQEIHLQFPQYPLPQIILTAALKGWAHDRERLVSTLRDRVQAKVVKSVIEQVDFLTSMLSVTNTEHLAAMQKYIQDPDNNEPPKLRVQSIKEYREVLDALNKLVAGASGDSRSKTSAVFAAADNRDKLKRSGNGEVRELTAAEILEAELDDS